MTFPRVTLTAVFFSALAAYASAQSPAPATSLDAARAAVARHDYKGAISILDDVVRKDPKNASALLLRGDAKDYLADEKGAIADYDAAIALDPANAYAYATRCYSEVEIGRYDAAVSDCSHALTLKPDYAFAYRGRANAEYFMNRLDAAEADAGKATQIDPHDAYAFLTKCRADSGLNNLLQAVQDCTRSIALQPADNTYFTRGQIYVRLHDYPKAVSDLQEALALNPSGATAYYWLAVAQAQQKNVDAALSDIDSYVRAAPADPDGLMLRALLEAKRGRVQATRADAQQALKLYTIARDDDGMHQAQSLLDSLPKP